MSWKWAQCKIITALIFCLSLVQVYAQDEFYAYKDGGAWSNPATWTQDPTGNTLVPIGGAGVPVDGAKVYINVSTVYLDADLSTESLEITIGATGTLDLREFKFTKSLIALQGSGRFVLQSAYFPQIVAYRTFLENGGGTVRYEQPAAIDVNIDNFPISCNNLVFAGKGRYAFKLRTGNTLEIFKNLVVEGDATLLLGGIPSAPDGTGGKYLRKKFIVAGDLSVNTPTAQILTIAGNIELGAGSGLLAYENTSHILEVRGNFTNKGKVLLHHESQLDFSRPSTDAHNVTYIARGTTDTQIRCEGQTDFYNLLIEKPVTHKTTLFASAKEKFRLYGQNVVPERVALKIKSGTLVLTGKVAIASLCEKGTYVLGNTSQLVLDGADVLVVQKAQNAAQVADIWGLAVSDVLGVNTVTNAADGENLELQGSFYLKQGTYYIGDGGVFCTGAFYPSIFRMDAGLFFAPQLYTGSARLDFEQRGGLIIFRGRRADTEVNTYAKTIAPNRGYGAIYDATPNYKPTVGAFALLNRLDEFKLMGGELRIAGADFVSIRSELFQILSQLKDLEHQGKIAIDLSGLTAPEVFAFRTEDYIGDLEITTHTDTQEVLLETYTRLKGGLKIHKGIFRTANNSIEIVKDLIVGGTLDATSSSKIKFLAKADVKFEILPSGQIKDNKINNVEFNSYNKDYQIPKIAHFIYPNTVFCNLLYTAGKTSLKVGSTHTIQIAKGAYLYEPLYGGLLVLEDKAQLQGYSTVDKILLLPNAHVSTSGTFQIRDRISLSDGSILELMSATYKFMPGAIIERLAGGTGYIQNNAQNRSQGVEKHFGVTEDTTGEFIIPFKHTLGATLHDRTMRITWTTNKDRYVIFSYKNSLHPMLREGFPFYVWAYSKQDISDLTLRIPNSQVTVPADFKALKLVRNQWQDAGTLTPTEITFNLISTASDYVVGKKFEIKNYVSVKNGNWKESSTWSPIGVPAVGDIVTVKHKVKVLASDPEIACGDLIIQSAGILDIPMLNTVNIARISGTGRLRICLDPDDVSHNVFATPTDISQFINNTASTIEYYMTSPNKQVQLSSSFTGYGNLVISYEHPNQKYILNPNLPTKLQIRGDLLLDNEADHANAVFAIDAKDGSGTIVERFLQIVTNFEDKNVILRIVADASYHKIHFIRKAVFRGKARIDLGDQPASEKLLGHLVFYSGLDDYTDTGLNFMDDKAYLKVTFGNNGSAAIVGNHPITFRLLDIGLANANSTLSVENIGGVLCGLPHTSNWLWHRQGILHLKSAFDLHLSYDTYWNLFPTATLLVDNDNLNVYIAEEGTPNIGLILRGALILQKGKIFIGKDHASPLRYAHVVYNRDAYSKLHVLGGELYVYGNISNGGAPFQGVLSFRQTGGKIYVDPQKLTAQNAGVDINGTEFEISGGEFIYNGCGGAPDVGDIRIQSINPNVTGGTLRLTAGELGKKIYITSTANFYNLICEGTNQVCELKRLPLVIKNDFKIGADSQFITKDLDLTIGGNWLCDGKYTGINNSTILNGSAAQTISGSATGLFFHDLVLQSKISVTYSVSLEAEIANNLELASTVAPSEQLQLGAHKLKLFGNLRNSGGYKTQGIGELTLLGTTESKLEGRGNYGTLAIRKAVGARAANDINLFGSLVLSTGNLQLDKFLLTVNRGSTIETSSNFHVSTAGSFVSKGIRYELTQGAQRVLFPLGAQEKYTPVELQIEDAGGYPNNNGYIRVCNITSLYGVLGECRQKVLNHHWEVEASTSTMNGKLEFLCPKSYKQPLMQLGESAPVRNQNGTWEQQSSSNLSEDATNLKILWKLAGATNLSGRYTAGPPLCFLRIKEVESIASGEWTDPIWRPYNTTQPVVSLPDGPNGLTVHVLPNHRIKVKKDGTKTKALIFDPPQNATDKGGEVEIAQGTTGVDFGEVRGTGALRMNDGEIPTADYSHFFGCANNGKLILAGTTDYNIPSVGNNEYPYLWLEGSGLRRMPAVDITVCKDWQIKDAAVHDNTLHNRGLVLLGTVGRESTASFKSGHGASAWVWFKGMRAQQLGGADADFSGTNAFYNVNVENEKGIDILDGGVVELKGKMRFKKGIVRTPRAPIHGGRLSITLTTGNVGSLDTELQGHALSYIDGPLHVSIHSGVNAYRFPLGIGGTLANQLVLRNLSAGDLRLEVVPNNITGLPAPPVVYVDQERSWKITGTLSNVTIGFVKEDFDWAASITSNADLRVVKRNNVPQWVGENSSPASVPALWTEIRTQSGVAFSAIPSEYSLGSLILIAPTVSFLDLTQKYCVPVGGTLDIPLRFDYAGNVTQWLPITILYKVAGQVKPPIIIFNASQLPAKIVVNYNDAPNSSDKDFDVEITKLGYTSGIGLHTKKILKVYRTPDISAGGSYSFCFTKGSEVSLMGTSNILGSIQWTSSVVDGAFDAPTALQTKYILNKNVTPPISFTLHVDNNGCPAEKTEIATQVMPPSVNITGDAEVCALGTHAEVRQYQFAPVPAGFDYTWSLEDVPSGIANVEIVGGKEHQNPTQVNWDVDPLFGADSYKSRVRLVLQKPDKTCRAEFEYPVHVKLKLRTGPLYYSPYGY